MKPLISVIIPVYNGEKFITEAIESCLSQTYNNLEIIVIDDGSTDQSGKVVNAYPMVQYFHRSNSGVASARNFAINKANGSYITFLDADDIMMPNRVELQLQALLNFPDIDICIGHQENFIDTGFDLSIEDWQYYNEREKINMMSIFLKSEVFEKVGLFNENYLHSSDYEWLTRAKDFGANVFIMPEILIKRRLHGNNISFLARKEKDLLVFRILKESMQRRRKLKEGSNEKN
jgi:glycosyltransferase involved in cell wall biosynthesis